MPIRNCPLNRRRQCAALGTGFVEHPGAYGGRQWAVFEGVNEACGAEQAALGVAPTDQCFSTGDAAVGHVDLRLVKEQKLAAIYRTV